MDNLQINEPDEKASFWSVTSYIFFLLPLISKQRKNEFVKFHFKQGFVWFFSMIIAYVLANINDASYIKLLIYFIMFILWCFGVMNAILGKKKPLPIIGWIATKLF